MAKAQAAIEILLDGPDDRNSHVARAVKLILDDHMRPLEHRINRLEETVRKHHPNPEEREVPASHAMFADRIQELTERYQQHMNRRFAKLTREFTLTPDSVFYTLTIMPVVINRALNHLNAEIITREPSDAVRMGYRSALLDVADELPDQKKALAMRRSMGDADNSRKRRFLEQAEAAAEDNERLAGTHRPDPGAERRS